MVAALVRHALAIFVEHQVQDARAVKREARTAGFSCYFFLPYDRLFLSAVYFSTLNMHIIAANSFLDFLILPH